MTADKARKHQARAVAAQTGMSYAAALRHLTDNIDPTTGERTYLCAAVHTQLVRALNKSGWQMDDAGFEDWRYTQYGGPSLCIGVHRDTDVHLFGRTEDAPDLDDPALTDLHTPPTVHVVFPYLNTTPASSREFSAEHTPAALADNIKTFVADTRALARANLRDDTQCGYCPDWYPAEHLIDTTNLEGGAPVCPACAFEPDIWDDRDPYATAFYYDRLALEDPAFPAAWGAVAALTAIIITHGTRSIDDDWRERDSIWAPASHWTNPGELWMWLPPDEIRPACWQGLGPGAPLGTLVSLLDTAYPNLRSRIIDNATVDIEDRMNYGAETDLYRLGDRTYTPEQRFTERRRHYDPIDELWPAVVAYAVGFTTQQWERPQHRSPWHVCADSLETAVLAGYAAEAGLDWDGDVMEATLMSCVILARAIFTDTPTFHVAARN